MISFPPLLFLLFLVRIILSGEFMTQDIRHFDISCDCGFTPTFGPSGSLTTSSIAYVTPYRGNKERCIEKVAFYMFYPIILVIRK